MRTSFDICQEAAAIVAELELTGKSPELLAKMRNVLKVGHLNPAQLYHLETLIARAKQ